MCLHPFLTHQLPAKFKDGLQIYQYSVNKMLSWCQGQRRGCSERRAPSCSDLLAPHSAQHGTGEKILGKNTYTSLLAAGHIYCIVFVMCSCPHLCVVVVLFFFLWDSSFTEWRSWVSLSSYSLFCFSLLSTI